ncbi:MAG TPA: universal stress protein [Thermoanaerobaculia bacterium]|nr:universal stress protein [Thermoanaerobaculia bacterium]
MRTGPVLAATDFSAAAELAEQQAAAIARALGRALHLVHAVHRVEDPEGLVGMSPDLVEGLRQAAADRLEQRAAALRSDRLAVTTGLDLGQPSAVIASEAEARQAALVAVGSRGLTGFRHLLLGSTAERVVRRATFPVLVVHPTDGGMPLPPRRVLLATDFSAAARAAGEAARELLGLDAECELALLHCWQPPVNLGMYAFEGWSAMSESYRGEVLRALGERLASEAEKWREQGLRVETALLEGLPAEAITAEAAHRQSDCIVLGSRGQTAGRWLFGSTAKRVVQQARCPVLTAAAEENTAAEE